MSHQIIVVLSSWSPSFIQGSCWKLLCSNPLPFSRITIHPYMGTLSSTLQKQVYHLPWIPVLGYPRRGGGKTFPIKGSDSKYVSHCRSDSLCCHYSTTVEGEQNGPPPNMPLWQRGYFELIIFKKLQTQESVWKQSYSFVRKICIYKESLP